MALEKNVIMRGLKSCLRVPHSAPVFWGLLFICAFRPAAPVFCGQTEMGLEGDLLVLGADGTAPDPNVKINGFTVFGSTQVVYTGGAAAPGNVVVNGALAVSSGSYFLGSSTFTAASNIYVNDGSSGQVLAKNTAGYLQWTSTSSIGDNLGSHIATTTLNMSGFGIVSVSTISASGIYVSSYGVIQTAGPGLNGVTGTVRGTGAVDLQPFRGSAGDVASGNYSMLGGGQFNSAGGVSSTVGGGWSNSAPAANATVSGGSLNAASGSYSTVPGGYSNTALGQYAFAAGYASSSTAAGTFTWTDSQGVITRNAVADRTLFKNRGGFIITGSTSTNMTGASDRGLYVSGNGLVGVSTGTPYAALDVVSSGTAANVYAQIWRNSNGVAVASMTSQGNLYGAVNGQVQAADSGITLTGTDFGKTITVNSGSNMTVNLPAATAADIGATVTVVKLGAGNVTIQAPASTYIADSGIAGTLYNSTPSQTYATVTIRLVTSAKWVLMYGDGCWTTN